MREANMKRDWTLIKPGTKVMYRSSAMIHPEATYKGTVVKRYDNYILVKGAPIPQTMNEKIECNPIPYNFCIPKYLTDKEHLMIGVDDNAREKVT